MNRRRLLARYVAVRKRERDRAAAAASAAEAARLAAERARDAAAVALDDHDASIEARADQLDLFDTERRGLRGGQQLADDQVTRAAAAAAAARGVVSGRERALRVAEAARERVQREWAAMIARREQAMLDDLAAMRRRRAS